MGPVLRACALLASSCVFLFAEPTGNWSLAANAHFEIYSEAGPESACTALAWFERLRAWVIRETGLRTDGVRPARVIGFASAREYQQYRLHALSDAYYVHTEGRDSIVLALAGAGEFGVAAHEYAHLVLHASGLELPPWLDEGLSEVFATVRIDNGGGTLGGDRPEHSQLLRRTPWMPLSELVRLTPASRDREGRAEAALFYAESWALADMLAFSPKYQPRLRAFLAAVAAHVPAGEALTSVYTTSIAAIASDLHIWVSGRRAALPLKSASAGADAPGAAMSEVSPPRMRLVLAALLLDTGEDARAEALCRELLPDAAGDADVYAILGAIALRRNDAAGARAYWSRAIERGVSDDALCYRYSILAQDAGMSADEIRPVLERAVALRPAFDDARYSLALLERNAGRMEVALDHLRALRTVPSSRAFSYWAAMSDTLNSLGRYEEAEAAAATASVHAATPAERAHAAQLAFIASTDIAVRLAPDAEGRARMVTTRIPRHTQDWNPFIEPKDDVRRATGVLREVDCSGNVTRVIVETEDGSLMLSITDPARVQMRNGPAEFTCGTQPGNSVAVVYAASQEAGIAGIVRGIEFR
jgi:tetratricopeptide (TPR) repeat protein